MPATLVTAPTSKAVSLEDLKLHCRIDGTDEDEYLEGLIQAATDQVEDITQRKLLSQTWDYSLDCWPDTDYIKLPFGNLQNALGTAPVVTWKDDDGTVTTLTVTTNYLVETNGEQCGRIVLPYMVSWPVGILYPSNPINVRFFCGWTTVELVPFRIKAAIKMIAADLYENREYQTMTGVVGAYVENKTVMNLLWPCRLWDNW